LNFLFFFGQVKISYIKRQINENLSSKNKPIQLQVFHLLPENSNIQRLSLSSFEVQIFSKNYNNNNNNNNNNKWGNKYNIY